MPPPFLFLFLRFFDSNAHPLKNRTCLVHFMITGEDCVDSVKAKRKLVKIVSPGKSSYIYFSLYCKSARNYVNIMVNFWMNWQLKAMFWRSKHEHLKKSEWFIVDNN